MKHIGILTSGGDCPGLNAAIRGVGRAAQEFLEMELLGFRDGFRGLVHDRTMPLESNMLSGILTSGGTILGTSRDKPHQMEIGGKICDMTRAILDTYRRNHLDALICIGGGGTHKIALRLKEAGLKIVTLPKTIDNDLACTDVSAGIRHGAGHRHRGHRSPPFHGHQPQPDHCRRDHGASGGLAGPRRGHRAGGPTLSSSPRSPTTCRR